MSAPTLTFPPNGYIWSLNSIDVYINFSYESNSSHNQLQFSYDPTFNRVVDTEAYPDEIRREMFGSYAPYGETIYWRVCGSYSETNAEGYIETTVVCSEPNYFSIEKPKITVQIDPPGCGKVIFDPPMPSGGYIYGTTVTLTAIANSNYRFVSWYPTTGNNTTPIKKLWLKDDEEFYAIFESTSFFSGCLPKKNANEVDTQGIRSSLMEYFMFMIPLLLH